MTYSSVSIRRWSLYCGVLACLLALLMSRANGENAVSIHGTELLATWRLVENFPDNRFSSELTVHNSARESLAPPWKLYFNSSMQIDPKSIEPPLVLNRVNGDLYALRAERSYPPIEAGENRVIRLGGSPWAINVSDAPSGLYLIKEDESGDEGDPFAVPLEIAPFPTSDKIRRGASDLVPVVTSASRYEANLALTKLPIDKLSPIIPTPMSYARHSGVVTIDAATTIIFDASLTSEAELLSASLESVIGLKLQKRPAPFTAENSIHLKLGDVKIAGIAKPIHAEAYSLSVKPGSGVEIVGTDTAGVFYGIQSLRGLVPLAHNRTPGAPLSIPAIEIVDAPRFGYRGLMLDVGRNFQRVDTVKKLLDLMAFYKLNRFHWHLSDDEGWRIEIKSLPELTAVGGRREHVSSEHPALIPSYGSGPFTGPSESAGNGFYTQDQIVDVIRYAHARHITVIPEIDLPGHSRAAIQAMAARARTSADAAQDLRLTDPDDTSKYESVQGWRDNVIDVGRVSTYQFLDVVIGELAAMYRRAGVPLEYVHLGGDEVPKGAWDASPACINIKTPDPKIPRGQQLEIYFLKRACSIVEKHNATPACWDDCLLAAADTDWPKRPLAYVWNNVWGWGREDVAYRLANRGFDVVMSNATNLYFDLATEKDPLEPGYYWAAFVNERAPFEFNPLDVYQNAEQNSMGQPLTVEQLAKSERLTPPGRKHILGIQGQLWGENLRTADRLEYMAFPRTIGLAERAWAAEPGFAKISDPAARRVALAQAWNEFAITLGQRELPRLHELAGDLQYRVQPPGVLVRDGQLLANVAYPGLEIRFTTDGSEPRVDSPVYDGPIASESQVRLRAFDAHGHGSRTVDSSALPAK